MPKITICRCPKFASAKNIPNPLVVIIFISFDNTRSCQCVFILDLKMEQYMTEQNFRVSWDSLQTQYQCCGTLNFNTGYTVWKSHYGRHNNSVPDSCCHQPAFNCGSHVFDGTIPPLHIHTHGCFTVIQTKLEQEVTLILTVIMVLQVVIMILTLVTLILSLCQASNDSR